VDEIKEKDLNLVSKLYLENIDRRHIIDANPTAIVAIATIQPEEPTNSEEGEHLFHS
jgi:hypothetical protein